MYNDSLLKKISKAKKLAEQDAKNAFLNGGYENAAKEIQSLSDEIYQANRSGKNVNPDKITELNNKLLRFNSFAATAGFDDKTRESLLGMGRSYVSLKDALKANNDTLTSRNTTYKQIDDIGKQQFKNIWFGMEINKEKDQAEAMRLREKKSKLKEKVAQYNRDIAPYLDVEATKKRLDNTSFFDLKAHARAKTDYQNAREMKTGREAEEWLQDKDVKKLSVQAGTAAAAQETIDSSGNKANLKAAKEARYFSQYKDKLKSTIKGRGYKDSDDELDKLVDEIVRRGKMDVTEKQQIDINKKLQEYTKAHPVIGSFAAAAAGTVAKVPGAKYALSQAIKGFISDERVYNDPNSAYFFGSNAYNQVTTAVKDEIAKHIKNKYDDPEVIKSKIKDAQMMYDGAMSGLENIIRAVTTAGVGEAYALVPMALAQLSDIALQKTIEGYSPTDAGYYAFIGAVAEYATEKMGIDALFSKVPGGRNVIVGYLSKLLKVGAAEGAEEIVSDVINDAADCLYEFLSDKKSVREKEISNLMREGMSYKEAAEAYTHNKINEYIDDAVMGAAVGAVLGGGSTAVNISARTANIARNLSASKQQAQAANQQTINAIQKEFGGRLTVEAAADVAKERGQWIDGNAYYENLIEQAKNSYDPKVAQMGIDAEDDYRYQKQMKDGRVSIAKAGRLINHISAANIRATTGMATQMLESVGAKSGTVKAVVNAINGEELSRKDIKNIKNSPDALSMLSQLYQDNTGEAIFLSTESDNDTIREVAGAVQGATFNIDGNTDAGKLYSMAAAMRTNGDIGFNGVKGFMSGYRENLNMSLEEYANMFKLAYNESKAGKSPEAIAEHIHSIFAAKEADEATTAARDAAILRAALTAQNDIEHEKQQAEQEKKEAKQEAEEDVTDNLHSKSGLEENTSEADPVTQQAVESAKKLSRLTESEKAEKYKNGGAIVESKQKLTTQQSAIISFYDYRGKKHGITYRFVDKVVNDARGTYKDNIVTIQINGIEDMTSAAGHELGHYLQENFPEEYKALQDYIKNTLFKQKGISFEEEILKTIENYKENGQNIDRDMAFEEITNDCLFGVDMASSEYEEFVRANETLMQKAFRVIRELLQDLQHFMEDWRKQLPGLYKKVTNIDMIQALYDDVEFMEYTADWVDGILNRNANEVAENANKVAKNENTTAQSAERFSFGNSKAGEQRDKAYMQAAQNGDEEKAAEYVEQAAKEWGAFSDGKPAPINLYHGTMSFGFTEFDLKKMDDGRSIFLTSDLPTAQSYSGTFNERKIFDNSNYKNYELKDLVKPLKRHFKDVGVNNAKVEYFSEERIKSFISKTQSHLEKIKQLIEIHRDNVSTLESFDDEMFIKLLSKFLDNANKDVEKASTAIHLLSNDIWNYEDYLYDRLGKEEFASAFTDINILSAVFDYQNDGVITVNGIGWGGKEAYTKEKTVKTLTSRNKKGNYSLYARLNNPLVINCNGRNWNNIEYAYNEVSPILKRRRTTIKTGTTREISEYAQKAGYDGVIFKNIRDNGGRGSEIPGVADYIAVAFDSSQVKSADPVTYDDNGEIIPLSERFSDDKDIRYSFGNKKITPNMSDEERAEVLKNTELSPVDDKSEEYGVITSDYDGIKSKIEKPLRDKLREIGAFRKYSSKAIDFDFEFTAIKGYKKSTHQQLKYGGDYHDLAKVLSNLQELLEKAVLIETHFDRDIGTKFEKPYAKQFYTLMSLLKDEETLIPVQFEIIEYLNNDNKLYVAVAMSKIAASDIMEESISEKEKEVDVTGNTSLEEQDGTDLLSTSKYSIRDIFKNINPVDKLFLKYVPDKFLSEEQISAKREALEEEKKRRIKTKTSDNDYMQAVENGNNQEQQRLVDEAAEKAFSKSKIRDEEGKLIKVYHGTFADFTEFDSSKGRTNMDIRGSFFSPWDIDAAGYGPNVRAFYLNITNPAPEAVAYKALNSHKGENGAGEKARNDLIKMGYNGVNNSNEEYIAFFPEQIKSADPVTYDDNGDVIPLSERFSKSKDYRYQFANTLTPEQQAAIERKATRREMAKLERENENLKAALDAALKQTKLSKDFRHDESKTAQIAKKLLRKFGVRDVEEGDYRFNRFVDALNRFYDTIDDSKLEGTGGSDVTYMAALEAIESVRDSLEETDYTNADYLRDFLSDIGAPDSQGRIRYIYLNEDAARSVLENYGSFRNVISHTGNIHFKALQPGESHATLDEIWESEIAGKWGDVVTGASEMSTDGLIDLTDSTMQAQVLINAIENARDVVQGRNTYNPLGDKTAFEAADEIIDGEATSDESYIINEMIMELYESYNDAEWQATFADKKANKERVKYLQYRSKLRQSMDRYRRQVNERNETYRKKIEKNYQERYNKAISRNDLRVQMEKERLANYKERVAESRKKATERKRQTELKNKIRKIALELARLGGNPNKQKHMPSGLLKVTKEFLQAFEINMTGAVQQKRFRDYIDSIKDEFKNMETNPDYKDAVENWQNRIKDQLEDLELRVRSKNINELDSNQLQDVYLLAREIKRGCIELNGEFINVKNATPEEFQENIRVERKGKKKEKVRTVLMPLEKFIANDKTPYYFFEGLQSPTMMKMYRMLTDGLKTWHKDSMEAEAKLNEIKEKYHYSDWNQREKFHFKLESGEEIDLNLQMIMSMKAYSEREAGITHILGGGAKFANGTEARRFLTDKLREKYDDHRYNISEKDFYRIYLKLTPEQIGFVHEMRDYLTSLGEKGNEVSRAMWDIELFNEKKYFPIRTVDEYNRMSEHKVVDAKKMKYWGSSKPLIPNADNPIMVEEFMDVVERHIHEMSLYHSLTIPLENFQKVYGHYRIVNFVKAHKVNLGNGIHAIESVDFEVETGSIRDCFTKAEQDYISNFLQDVNGGVLYENNTGWDKAIAKTKKMTTALNLRVTAQQPGALARAFAYVEPKYFGTAMHKGAFGIKADSKTVKEMETYSVNAFIKKIGGFDTGTGMSTRQWLDNKEYKGKQKVRAFFDDGQYRDQKLLFAPEMMDRITWVQIWEACKNKIAVEEKLTGEELRVRAGKFFDEVTEKTQVYDSVFSRSGYMRSKNALAKMFTAYMAEPTKTINMLWDAFVNHHGNAKFVAGVTASVITSIILTNLLASPIDAMRHGKDDDNGWELWTGELTADIISDLIPFNYLPIVRDIYSIFSGYDVKRTDLSLVSDFVKATKKFIKANQDGTCTYDDWFTFISAACAMVGLPTKSVWKDIKGIWTMAKILGNDTTPTVEGFKKAFKKSFYDELAIDDFLGIEQPSENKYDIIYQLYAAGKYDKADARMEALVKKELKSTKPEYGESDAEKEKRIREKIESGWESYIKQQMFDKNEFERIYQFMLNGDTKKAVEMKKSLLKESLENVVLMKDEKKEQGQARVKEYFEKTYQSFMQGKLKDKKEIVSAAKVLSAGNLNQAKTAITNLTKQGFTEEDVLKSIYKNINAQIPEGEDFSRDGAIFRVSYSRSLEANALVNTKSMKAAALADIDHDIKTRVRIQNSLRNSGYKQDDIRRATDYLSDILKGNSEDSEGTEQSIFKASDLGWATLKADTATIRVCAKGYTEFYLKTHKAKTKEDEEEIKKAARKNIRTQISKIVMDEYYKASSTRRGQIRQLMLSSGAYDNGDAVLDVCNGWVKQIAKKKFG